MMRRLHVAAAQIHSGGPLDETLKRVGRQVAAAAAVEADLLLFAEGALHGYDAGMTRHSVRAVAEPPDGPRCRRVAALARRHGVTILIGFFERTGDRVFNSALVAPPRGACWTARKHALTPTELAAGLAPGPRERPVLEIEGVRCAIVICADGGIDGLHEDLRARSVDYRLCPTGGGGTMAEMLHERDLLTADGRATYVANWPRRRWRLHDRPWHLRGDVAVAEAEAPAPAGDFVVALIDRESTLKTMIGVEHEP